MHPGSKCTPDTKLPSNPRLRLTILSQVCLANKYIPCVRHALTLERMSSRSNSDADYVALQEANPYTTESLDRHKPYHTAGHKLP
jgi:hypothetical protein